MNSMASTKKEIDAESIEKCVVANGRIIPYQDENEPVFGKSFYLILKIFQFEVFSYLIATSETKNGTFEKFMEAYNKYFAIFELGEERIGRAHDISLDSGFLKPKWKEGRDEFFREFKNDSEACEFFQKVLSNYKKKKRGVQKNIELFEKFD